MELPKFLLGDNTDHPDAIFIVHTEYPRFIINLADDEITWMEEFSKEEESDLMEETERLITLSSEFYDREISRYDH